ncbi:MAG: dihydroorotase [Spirochaetota bacterium]
MTIDLRAPDDFHVHLRQAPLLTPVVRETARWFARVLVMPNTIPPITTAEGLDAYRREILASLPPGRQLEPLLTFKLVPDLDPASVSGLAAAGAIGGKLYPQGVTTNSSDGAANAEALYPIIEAMEANDLVLEIHAELPGAFSLDRETAFLPTVERIAARFPKLRVVIEHVSSAETLSALANLPETVAATVTVHHLYLTLDDVVGGDLRPHYFCKPIAKRPADRAAIRDAVFGGNRRVFFGSDSAPHPRGAKESDCGCAGIYTAPVALPLLAELFDREGLPLRETDAGSGTSLEAFVSRYGAEFYRVPINADRIILEEREWTVPAECAGVVPFRAGERLRYDLRYRGGQCESGETG